MSLLKRFEGVLFRPKPAFEELAARPVWIDALVFLLAALIIINLVIAPYSIRDQLERDKSSAPLKEKLGDEIYQKRIDALENPSRFGVVSQTIVYTALLFIVASLLQAMMLYIVGRLAWARGSYRQVLAVLLHASVIDKVLGNALRLILVLWRGSIAQTSTGLAMFFPRLDSMSMPYIMLNQVDIFQLWMFGFLALGLSAVFKIRVKQALLLSSGLFLAKAAVNIGLGFISSSFYH